MPSPDARLQQATVDLFADMSVQPMSLQPGLVASTISSDTAARVSVIDTPAHGANLSTGSPVTVSGTASDTGGGVVAGVEVSTDGGASWHPAAGRGNWSYLWNASGSGSITLMSRAVDDSGNVEMPAAGVTVSIGGGCTSNCSIWRATALSGTMAENDTNAVELGYQVRG